MSKKTISALSAREKIIKIYKKKVHGKIPDTSQMTGDHDGKKGHWLEDKMGSKRDASNTPDLLGYEMKTGTSKTTFGDWGPDYFIFRDKEKFSNLIGITGKKKQEQEQKNKDETFLKAFGEWRDADEDSHMYKLDGKSLTWKDIDKDGYYSWSGTPSPSKVTGGVNDYGQALVVNEDNSISITYCFSKDTRENKSDLVPEEFRIENLRLFGWSNDWIKEKVENKFNVHGWFKCNIKNDKFCEIIFGEKITVIEFLKWTRHGEVIFDTRLKEKRPDGTDRYGMQWRAASTFWKSKSIQTYPGQQI